MLLTQTFADSTAAGIAAIGPSFGSTDLEIGLAKAAFTPGLPLLIGDIDVADFDGYAGKGWDPTLWAVDPASGLYVFYPTTPAGGFSWETTGVTNLPQTIHGYYLVDTDSGTLAAAALLDTPVVLTAANQIITIPLPTVTLSPAAFL